MGIRISGPHLGPVHTTLWSSGHRKSGGKSYAGRFILAWILLGATFGVSPVLGWLVLVAAAAIIVTLLVRYLRPAKPQPAEPAASKTAKPDGPRDWTPSK